MFVVDAFVVNVAIPSIRAGLSMSEAQIEAVIVVYQIAFATSGDHRRPARRSARAAQRVFAWAAGVYRRLALVRAGGSGGELIAARLAQGAAAALMSPQVLATIHTLFPDEARSRAFAVFGISLGLGGAVGVVAGGWLVALEFVRVWLAHDLLRQRTDRPGDRDRGVAPAAGDAGPPRAAHGPAGRGAAVPRACWV